MAAPRRGGTQRRGVRPARAASQEQFSIRAERRGSTHCITASGELGPRASFRLHDEFYRALPTDAAAIVVDLREVTSVDRGAVNTLAFMRRRSGRRVRIIPSSPVAAAVHGLAQLAHDRA